MNMTGMFRRLLVVTFLLVATGAAAGDTLNIRLVRADNQGGVDPAVQDVVQAMGKEFSFKGFHLETQASIKLPAAKPVVLGGYIVECTGAQKELGVKVSRDGKSIINATVSLMAGKPVLLGGLPVAGSDARQIVVLLTP